MKNNLCQDSSSVAKELGRSSGFSNNDEEFNLMCNLSRRTRQLVIETFNGKFSLEKKQIMHFTRKADDLSTLLCNSPTILTYVHHRLQQYSWRHGPHLFPSGPFEF